MLTSSLDKYDLSTMMMYVWTLSIQNTPPTLAISAVAGTRRRRAKDNSHNNHNQRQLPKCLYIKHSGRFSTFKISLFHIKIQSKNHICSDTSFWNSFFKILGRLGTKKMDFGNRLAPSWITKWRPKSTISQRWWHLSQKCDRHFADSLARSPSGALLGTILVDLGWNFEEC